MQEIINNNTNWGNEADKMNLNFTEIKRRLPVMVEFDTDIATTRLSIVQDDRYWGKLISYVLPDLTLIVEQYKINNVSNVEFEKNINWELITSKKLKYTNPNPMVQAFRGFAQGETFNNVDISEILNKILYPYIAPEATLTNNINEVEIGTTLTSLTLSWTINKIIATQKLFEGTYDLGLVPINLNVKTLTGSWTSVFANPLNFSILISDGTNEVISTTSIKFSNKRYWGVSNLATLTDSEIIGLLSKEFSNSRQQTRNFNCTGGKYIYFVLPHSFNCSVNNFKVGGLFNSEWTITTRNFTNNSGGIVSYDIIRFNNLLNGNSINVEII